MPLASSSELAKKGRGSYQSRGFIRLNKGPLTRESALGLGMSKTDEFANATFKVVQRKTTGEMPSSEFDYLYRQLRYKFRSPARKGREAPSNTFIEKNKFRIDTQQEREDIPYEAARQRRAGLFDQAPRSMAFGRSLIKVRPAQQSRHFDSSELMQRGMRQATSVFSPMRKRRTGVFR